jgi:hypothetical protein
MGVLVCGCVHAMLTMAITYTHTYVVCVQTLDALLGYNANFLLIFPTHIYYSLH